MNLISRSFACHPLPWLLLLALVVIGAGIGLRDPSPADEPRFALAAKQMVESGEWLFPHRGRELYSDKPPPFMWLQAFAFKATGEWRIAFLLPSLLAALGTLALVYDLTRRLYGRRTARYAFLALLFTLHFTFQAKRAQIDPVIVFWITLSVYGLLRHLLLGPNWRWHACAWFAAGIGTITKGVGFLALAMLVPYVFAHWRGWRRLAVMEGSNVWRWASGVPLFIAAIALWLVPMLAVVLWSGDPALHVYARDILFRQTAERYAEAWHHLKPSWYYLGIVATLWLPGVLLLPWLAPAWWRRLRRRDARVLLPLAWALLLLVFFSLSPGKRDVYILPALPMLTVAAAPLLPGVLRRRGARIALWAWGILLGLLALGAGLAALIGHPAFEQRVLAQRGLGPASTGLWWMLTVLGMAVLIPIGIFGIRRAAQGTAVALSLLWLIYGLWAMPLLNLSSSARGLMREVEAQIGPDTELGLVAWKEQNLLQLERPVTDFGFLQPWPRQWKEASVWLRAAPERRAVFAFAESLGPCIDTTRVETVGTANRREWVIVRAAALRADCDPVQEAGANNRRP